MDQKGCMYNVITYEGADMWICECNIQTAHICVVHGVMCVDCIHRLHIFVFCTLYTQIYREGHEYQS